MREATAIRFDSEEKSWIRECADFEGVTFSDFVRNAALEKVEDAIDAQDYASALMEDDGKRYTMDEVMKLAIKAD